MQENKSNIVVYNDGELELNVSVENESVSFRYEAPFLQAPFLKKFNYSKN